MPTHSGSDLPSPPPGEITTLLAAYSQGDPEAFELLIPLVYDGLRAIAHRHLRQDHAHPTLNTTAIVHEAYLKLVGQSEATWRDRSHFFAFSARVIRNLLIDYGRERGARKRGGQVIHLPLHDDMAGDRGSTVDLLALDEALNRLGQMDERLERLVEYRFFGGMTMAETAQVLGISLTTAERDWRRARAYLYRALAE